MVFGKASLEAIIVSAIVATTVTGHGNLVLPPTQFLTNGDRTSYMATIMSSASGFVVTSSNGGEKAEQFADALESSQYSTLKEFVQDKMVLKEPTFTRECGYTDPDAPPQPLPPQYVEWGHGPKEGLTLSHDGCCEVHCGKHRVFYDRNCPKHFPTAPARLPYDREACLGASRLDFYWIALHTDEWQVYINCVPLEETTSTGATSKFEPGSGGGKNSTTPSSNGRTPSPGGTGTSTPPSPGGTGNSTPPSPGGTGNSTPPSPGGTGNSTPPSPGGNSPPPYTPGGTGNPPSPSPGGTGNPPSPSPGGTGNSTPPSSGGNSPPPYTPGGTGNPPSPSPGGTGTSTPPSPGGTGNSPPSGNGNKCVRRLES